MRSHMHARVLALGALILLLTTSCQRAPARTDESTTDQTTTTTEHRVSVSRIDLGKNVGTDRTIAQPSLTFVIGEPVYASVVTTGTAPSAEVTARWTTLDGVVIDESTQTITPTGAETVSEFHISRPEGLQPGRYRLEIFVDGTSAATKEFEVTGS